MSSKKTFIIDLQDGQTIDHVFLLTGKAMPTGKTGKRYMNLKLSDKTGEIEGKIWENAIQYDEACQAGQVVLAKGRAQLYQGKLQLNLLSIELVPDVDVVLSDFLPSSKIDPEIMYVDMMALIKTHVSDPDVKRLLFAIFEDQEIAAKYKKSPAAKSMHHVFIGGLLEHALGLSRLAIDVCKHYPHIDLSYVIAGCLLHDAGKIDELGQDRNFEYTDDGRLLGHLIIGIEMVTRFAAKLENFPKRTEQLVKHLIASHHGRLEYGSPKLPQTLEALMVHYLDDMDSKLQAMKTLIDKEWTTSSKWTSYHRLFDRCMYKGTQWEDKNEN